MSRIHEALQRAAEERTADEPVLDGMKSEPVDADEVAALARELFPIEMGVPRVTRAPAADLPLATGTDEVPNEPEGAEAESPQNKRLFDRIDVQQAEKVVADENMSTLAREQYRRLAGVLHDAQGNSGLRVILVASAWPAEGKTLTALNVALTLSESYRRRVLLIDADLRKPALHRVFRLNTTSGLIDGLETPTTVKLVVRQVSPHLWVLPAGRPTSDPMAGLTSDRMRRLLEEAKEAFDWVIIDSPPLITLPDAHLLSSIVDGAIVVVKANHTPHDMVKRTADIIGRNRVIGVVLNQAESNAHAGYDSYYADHYLRKGKGGSVL